MRPIRRQPRIEGGREPIWGALDPEIKRAIVQDAKRFNVSKSFVVNTALGLSMGIRTTHYYELDEPGVKRYAMRGEARVLQMRKRA